MSLKAKDIPPVKVAVPLPSYVVVAISHLEHLVDAWDKAVQEPANLIGLCVKFQHLCDQYDALTDLLKQLYAIMDNLNKNVIPNAFEHTGVDKIAIPELERSFYPVPKYSASLVDREAAFKWLREKGQEALITETVNAGTLAAFLKGRLLEEGLDPPECMKLTSYKITGSSKYKPKGKS